VLGARLAELAGPQHLALRVVDVRLEAGQRPRAVGLGQRMIGRGAVAQSPGTGADRGDRGAEGELEQGRAVEVSGESLADAADRLAQAAALLPELGQAPLELLGHVVELGAERRELVVSVGRHGSREVAAGQPPGRLEEAGDLALESARGEHGE